MYNGLHQHYRSSLFFLLRLLLFCGCFFLTFIGRVRPASPYFGNVQTARGAYVGGFGYQQPVSYNYQQGLVYPPYG